MSSGGRRLLHLTAAAVLSVGGVVVLRMTDGPADLESPRTRARALYLEGLDHYARGEEREMFSAMRAAWLADPAFIPAVLDMLYYYAGAEYFPPAVRDLFETIAQDATAGLCMRVLLAEFDQTPTPRLTAAPYSPCADVARLMLAYRAAASGHATARAAIRLSREFPDSPWVWGGLMILGEVGWWDSLLVLTDELTRPNRHPLTRARGFAVWAAALHGLGRHTDAVAVETEGEALTRGSPSRVRYLFVGSAFHHGGIHTASVPATLRSPELARHIDSLSRWSAEELRRISQTADPFLTMNLRLARAVELLDDGDLTESIREFGSLAAHSDSLGDPDLQSYVHMRLGRALVKNGDWGAAERELLAARSYGRHARALDRAYEVEHNLLHLYESQGRDAEARTAGEAFVRLTRRSGLRPVRMMSYRDLAWFHWRRGDHEEARPLFEAMVADADSLESTHYYVGEYFELIGDLDRASSYYARVGPTDQEYYRTMAGLVRVAESVADTARAIQYARLHDAALHRFYPEDIPLLPGVLARAGRPEAAADELRTARDRAAARGQPASWAKLTLQSATLAFERGDLDRAAALSDSAASVAARVAEADVAVRARALNAMTRLRLEPMSRSMTLLDLRDAVRDADRMRLAQLQADVELMLGDGLASLDSVDAALRAYRRAAGHTDSVATSLALDANRAGYRAVQLEVSNRALALIVSHARDSEAPTWFAEFTARRKSRGIADGDRPATHSGRRNTARSMQALRGRLTPQMAVVDYVVLDTIVAALVVTNEVSRVVHLPTDAESLRALISRLHARLAPQVGGAVDVSRSAFDIGTAQALYAALLEPIEPVLNGRTRLSIVPDTPLHLLPFDALILTSGANPTFALDRYTISLATSLAAAVGDPTIGRGTVVAVAGPAPADVSLVQELESEALAARLTGRRITLLQRHDATERAVRELAGDAAILHFASHARPNDHDPDYSYITLRPDTPDDGRLHAYEIRLLDLSGTLAVLSACETATGWVTRGEGPLSLSRAFLQAGASGVIATLWPVGAASTELMKEFYRAIGRGEAVPEALRSAKRVVRHAYPNPLHWGAFALVTRGGVT